MDGDENDLLSTNLFIPQPDLTNEVTNESNEEFKKYYKNEMDKMADTKMKQMFENVSLKSIQLDEETDMNSLLNTNQFKTTNVNSNINQIQEIKRYKKDIITYVNIDSRDRDKLIYTKANHFKLFLGKTFYNVKSVKLVRIEFPNTDAVINSANNRIYWRNLEDIEKDIFDTITKSYRVYQANLRIGSYIASSIQSEIMDKMSIIKRQNLAGDDYHYFTAKLDIDTDIVTFTSLILTQLNNNPLSVGVSTNIITVTTPTPHNLQTGDIIYIIGSKNIAGITADLINTSHTISVIGADKFQIEVNVKASETAVGGGNVVSIGRLAPFQLLFGEKKDTVAPNLGFPFENSSERINTYIQKIEKLYLLKITTAVPHKFKNTYDYLNKTCLISLANPLLSGVNGNKVICKIIDSYSFLILHSELITSGLTSTGTVYFDVNNDGNYNDGMNPDQDEVIGISSVSNYDRDTILVTTFHNHNYEIQDINIANVRFYDTNTTPELEDSYILFSLLSGKELIIQGNILEDGGISVSNIGDGGSISRHDPLKSQIYNISSITPGPVTTITCTTNHNLEIGQKIKFYNINTSPPLITNTNLGIHTILTIPTSNSFTIDVSTANIDNENIDKGLAYIGTNILTLSYPNHKFNQILSIDNYSGSNYVKIKTSSIHNLVTGDVIKIINSNSTPSIDGNNYTVTNIDNDELSIVYTGGLVSGGNTGMLCKTSNIIDVQSVTNDNYYIKLTSNAHGFNTGNIVKIINSNTTPSIDGNYNIIKNSNNNFLLPFNGGITSSPSLTGLAVTTSNIFDISIIEQTGPNSIRITTTSSHNFVTNDTIRIINSDSSPTIDNSYSIVVISPTEFTIIYTGDPLSVNGTSGLVGKVSNIKNITDIINDNQYIKVKTNVSHQLSTDDTIKIFESNTVPNINNITSDIGYSIKVIDNDEFLIPFSSTLTTIGTTGIICKIGNIKTMTNITTDFKIKIKTKLPHNLETDDYIRIMETNCTPIIDCAIQANVDSRYKIIKIDDDEFIISYVSGLTSPGTFGILGLSNDFYLYGATSFGGIPSTVINNIKHTVKKVIDENTITFEVTNYATNTLLGGGANMFISSLFHGFNGIQTNTKNSLLYRSINLEGENYAYICCPQLSNMMNTGNVKDIFARVSLDQSPGNVVFNFISNPKTFDTVPLDQLNELEFSVVYYNNLLYEFNDLDYSFVLEITEEIDTTDNFGISSKRGIPNL